MRQRNAAAHLWEGADMLWEYRSRIVLYQMAALLVYVVVQAVAQQAEFAAIPAPVAAAVEARFPGASWRRAKTNRSGAKTIHELTLRSGSSLFDVAVTPSGEIVEVEQQISLARTPPVVRDVLTGNYSKAFIRQVEEVTQGNVVVAYEATFDAIRNCPKRIVIDPSGRVVAVQQH
jgi:hypothetical protein